MEIKANSFSVDQNSTIPALVIYFEMNYMDGEEAPISVSGRILTDDLCLISHLSENYIVKGTSYELNSKDPAASEFNNSNREAKWGFHLTAPLSKESISHIEQIRERNQDKAVNLNFDLIVKYFSTKNKLTPIPSQTLLTLNVSRMKSTLRIDQPTWLKTCAPYFEIGNFLLLELRIPDKLLVDEFWFELYQRLVINTQEMESYIRIGDWENVLRSSRRFFDNIKIGDSKPGNIGFEENFQKLMLADGHTLEGVKNLYDGIWQLFEFTSKYAHDKDKAGNLKANVVTSKEDAYFTFAICVGMLNLLGRKISR